MSDTSDGRDVAGRNGAMRALLRRAGFAPLATGAAAAIFVALVLWGRLAPVPALSAFAALAAAIWAVHLLSLPAALARRAEDDAAAREFAPAYADMAERLSDPAFVIDRQGRVRSQNRIARKIFGAIAPGQSITFLLRAPEVGEAIQLTLETGTATSVTYFERVPADRWFEAQVAPLGDGASAPCLLVLMRDLTETQRVERMRADFVANASHELRTPLASLTGFIETLQGAAKNDPVARERFLEVMAEQAWRMSRLIEDLMSLSRIELKAHVRPEAVVDLVPLLRHVSDAMQPLADDSRVVISLTLPGSLEVAGDRDELAQVFQNLVHNAIKYGQAGGRVEISTSRRERGPGKPDLVSVSVRDFGPGIEPEHLPRLTERFYRIDAATSREKGGTGLGLAIVKHILNRHRGHLAIESEPGNGAVFTVQLDSSPTGVESRNSQATT